AQRRVLRKRPQCDRGDQQALVASIKVLADLAKLGWSIRVSESSVEICRPTTDVDAEAREYVRRQLHGQRDDQLRQPSVREFVCRLEARRPNGNQLVSIFSLMRDGADLASRLREIRRCKSPEDRVRAAA